MGTNQREANKSAALFQEFPYMFFPSFTAPHTLEPSTFTLSRASWSCDEAAPAVTQQDWSGGKKMKT